MNRHTNDELKDTNLIELKNKFSILKNYSFSREIEISSSSNYRHVHYGDIHTKYSGIIDNDVFIPFLKEDIKINENDAIKAGDVVMADASEDYEDLGKSVYIGSNLDVSTFSGLHTFHLRPNDSYDGLYFKYFTETKYFKKQMARLGTGLSVFGISKKNLENVLIPNIDINSQKKYAQLLSLIDDLIGQLMELEALYFQQKKSLLQIIFNNNSYHFTVLEKEFKFFNGKAYENEMDENGEYEIISLNSINIDGKINDVLNRLDTADAKLDAGDLVMILSDVAHGYFLGVTAIIPDGNRYVLNQRVGGLKSIDKYSSSFLRHYINHNQKYFKHIGQGTSQKNINKPDILKFQIPDIDIDEQNKISSLLTSIDELVSYQKNITNQYKELKKYYLNIIFK